MKLGPPFPEEIRAQFLGVWTHVHACARAHVHPADYRRPLWAVLWRTLGTGPPAGRVSETTFAPRTNSWRSEDLK